MDILYYDSGTTNTRAYLLRDGELLCHASSAVGSRDSALSKDNTCLLESLYQQMLELSGQAGIDPESIGEIWMSGMVSSPTGIIELTHLAVPADAGLLRKNVCPYYEPLLFKRQLHIIPGVKTLPDGGRITADNFYRINNMRGEETELFGILAEYPSLNENTVFLMPGSHTQIIFVKNGCIVDILSTITGELYKAVTQATILSTSLLPPTPGVIIPEMVCKGYSLLNELGFNRALYTVRTMELFLHSSNDERHSFFEGILNGGVVKAVSASIRADEMPVLAVYGSPESTRVLQILFQNYCPNLPFVPVPNTEIPYSARGFLEIRGSRQ